MGIDLNYHLAEKIYNCEWLGNCTGGDASSFPYHAKEKGKATLDRVDYIPSTNPRNRTPESDDTLPRYLVNTPVVGSHMKNLNKFLKLFKNEAFGTTRAESRNPTKNRLAIVIGVNQAKSLNPEENEDFLHDFRGHRKVDGIVYRVFKFFWNPQWEADSDYDEHLYSPETSFMMVKLFASDVASEVSTDLKKGLSQQVPYQLIRQRIKESDFSKSFANKFEQRAPNAPIYYTVMDDDAKGLRKVTGVFSHVDRIVSENNRPSAISCGYTMQEPDRPVIELGVKLDMHVREAMTRIIPYGAYLPEPGSFFCIRQPPGGHILKQLSFKGGQSQRLENRRLIENARQARLFNDNVVFDNIGGIISTTQPKMKTLKNANIRNLTPNKVKQKATLQALRGISQTHATPKQWADNLYPVLNIKAPQVTDVTGPIMRIFKVYDPISRMLDNRTRYLTRYFGEVIDNYDDPLTDAQMTTLDDERTNLKDQGLEDETIDLIIEAAKASGEAIKTVLEEAARPPQG